MPRQKRYPLLLDMDYPPEKQMLEVLDTMSEGQRAGALRALMFLGHAALERQRQQDLAAKERQV